MGNDLRAVLESPRRLTGETILTCVAVGVGVAGLLAVPVALKRWPWWYCALPGSVVGYWALHQEWDKTWHPLAVTTVAMIVGLLPIVVKEWPWWYALLGGLFAGSIALILSAPMFVRHHRHLLTEVVRASAQPVQIVEQPAPAQAWKPSPVCFARGTTRKMESTVQPVEADLVARNPDGVNFGYFLDLVFPVAGKMGLPPTQANWAARVMPSGDKLGRDGLREYKKRLVQARLAHSASNAPNADLILDGTREEAFECFEDLIVLPADVGR